MKKNKDDVLWGAERLKIWRIMKLCAVFMLFFVMGAAADSYSQKQLITLDMNQGTVNELFKNIRKQTGLQFVYNEEYVKGMSSVNISADQETVEEVLEKVFKDTPYHCVFEGDVIYVTRFDRPQLEEEQTDKITIKGKVTDENGEPVPGVAVMVVGTTNGRATDIDGNYELIVEKDPNLELRFSYIGMQTQQIKLGNRTVLNVVMKSANITMDEVMVVAYGTTKKESFTGSAVSVKGDKIMRESAGAVSPEKALKGYVAGVRVSRGGGQPGEVADLQIRGIGSITQATTPLYVVDGIPISSSHDLNNINPNDIENMTVLKDAAATSLYGSRASNGVVMITTKRGQEGKTVFEVNYERAISSEAIRHQLKGYYMDGPELTKYSVEALKNSYLYTQKALPGMENAAAYQSMQSDAMRYALENLNSIAQIRHPDDNLDGTFSYKNMTDAQLNKYLTHPLNCDWYDAMYKKGAEDKFNLSARGGNEKTNFYASLGYLNIRGITEGSSFERFSGRTSINNKATNYLDFTFIQSFAYTKQENKLDSQGATAGNPISTLGFMNPTLPVYLPDGSINSYPGFNPTDVNFVEAIYLDKNRTEWFSSNTNVSANVKFTDWLKFTSTNGLDVRYQKYQETWSPESQQGSPTNGKIDQERYFYINLVTSNLLNFNKTYDKHTVGALAGYEAKYFTSDWNEAVGQNFPVSSLMSLSNASSPVGVYGTDSKDRLVSWIFKADYNYDNKYFLTASYRRDGTSRLLPENRWGNFWSASGAWTISRESFMESTHDWLDNLRLKVSYGTNGTQPSSYFSSLTLFGLNSVYDSRPALYANSYGNKNITWETSYTWNVGMDFSVFNGRLRGTLEYYNKLTTDLINDRNVTYTSGWSTVKMNEGELRNTGVELTLDSRNIVKNDFTWETNFNISYMRAKVEEMKEEKESGNYIYREGENIYSYYVREWAGVDPETGLGQWYKNTTGEDGITVVDRTSKTSDINEVKKTIVKKGYPDFFGGLTNRFTYKGFDLSFLLTFTLGGTLFDSQQEYVVKDGGSLGNRNFRADAYKKAWKKPGDKTEFPIIIRNDPYNFSYTSTRSMYSSDHLKVKNISLGYTLPKKWTEKMRLSSLRLYVNGSDIYTFYKHRYVNPEVNNSGSYNAYSYPSLRSWRFGIDVKF